MASTTHATVTDSATDSATDLATTVPTYRRPRMSRHIGSTTEEMTRNGYIQRGRETALRVFYADLTTLDGDAQDSMERVLAGTGPQAYKDSFVETLFALAAMFDTPNPVSKDAR